MARDLNDVVNDIGMGRYHLVQLLLIGGVLISDGAEILVSSSVLSALKDRWHLSGFLRGLMMSIIFVGVFVGGFIGGGVADAYGRRVTILMSYVGIVIFGAATAATQGPIGMLCLRFFFGLSFGCGMGPGVSLQVETTPATWRGHVVNFAGTWFTVGEIYTAVCLMIFMPDLTDPAGEQWRYVTLLTVVPGLILMPFTFLLLQESPHYLLTKGHYDEAVNTMQYIALMNRQPQIADELGGDDPQQRLSRLLPNAGEHTALIERRASYSGASSSSSSRSVARRPSIEAAGRQRTIRSFWSIILGAEYRSIVLGGAYLCFISNFMFYGLTYSLPQIFATLKRDLQPAFEVFIISLCDIPGMGLAFLLIYSKSIGHRTGLAALAGSATILQLALISIDHGDKWLYLGLPAAYLAKWVATSFFTITYVYLGEVFPSSCRASALSLCISCGRVGSILAPILFEVCRKKDFVVGEHAIFLMVTASFALIGVVVIKCALYFELKNEPLQDIAHDTEAQGKLQEEGFSGPAPAG